MPVPPSHLSNPLISVITPVGPRHAEHVRVAAASVGWQSLAGLCEHVIACDGGADVAPMPGVTILPSDGERRGPAHTRNRAIAAARGAFILPLDADDYLLPRAVEHLLRVYARGTVGYAYGDAYTLERDGTFVYRSAPDYIQDHMRRYNQHVVSILVPTHLARAVGGYDERVDAWEDWTFHLRLAIAGVCGQRVPLPTLGYRVYEGDRMTRFYGGAPEHMEAVWRLYRTAQGDIPMASCCGGDATLASAAQSALTNIPDPEALAVAEGRVRIEYLGDERGSITWDMPGGRPIKLGNNASNRFADVSQGEYLWIKERVPVRVVPVFDRPEPPPPAPILGPADVLTADQTGGAVRP